MTTTRFLSVVFALAMTLGSDPAQAAPEGSGELSIVTDGDASIGGELLCPDGTDRAGAWCIGPQQGPDTYNNEVDFGAKSNSLIYFCCMARR